MAEFTLSGQWVGRFTGTNTGLAVLDLDELADHYSGHLYAFDSNVQMPSTYSEVHIPLVFHDIEIELSPKPLNPYTQIPVAWEHIRELFPKDIRPSRRIWLRLNISNLQLYVVWRTEVDTFGTAVLTRESELLSPYIPEKPYSWDEFRREMRERKPYSCVYRGQDDNRRRLRTAYHRTGRADLLHFESQVHGPVYQSISALTRHLYNLERSVEYAAFLALIQHHGYPTPLLDWTYSPFVACYFAYKNAHRVVGATHVRIFIFDKEGWTRDYNQVQRLVWAAPHFSILEAAAIDNVRLIPQQALSTATNIDDIEGYLRFREAEKGKRYLWVVDLPIADRVSILTELNLMGINAGSLFPGLDGACQQLKERFFGF